jgi:hypothetical protein
MIQHPFSTWDLLETKRPARGRQEKTILFWSVVLAWGTGCCFHGPIRQHGLIPKELAVLAGVPPLSLVPVEGWRNNGGKGLAFNLPLHQG